MDFIKQSPPNKNNLSPLGHKFVITRLPSTVYWCQSINVPDVSLPDIKIGNPFVDLNFAGDHVKYSPLQITFKVDEDMTNYNEILSWIFGLGFPERFEQFREIERNDLDGSAGGIRSDASVLINSSNMNANIEILYRDVFPISLSDLVFDTRLTDITYVTATATFSVRDFVVRSINKIDNCEV